MKDILKYANFGDKFLCRNGDIALYLQMSNKDGYSLQLVTENNPQHYDVDGYWHSQSYKENSYDIVSKVDDKGVLENILKYLQIAENEVLNEIRFCQEHKMDMESSALRYKCNAFEQFRRIIYKHEED